MKSLRSLWGKLTRPHPSIKNVERQRQSQWLSALLVVSLFFNLVVFIARLPQIMSDPAKYGPSIATGIGSVTFYFALAYFLNRAGRYVPAALLLTTALVFSALQPPFGIQINPLFVIYTPLVLLLTSILFGWKSALVIAISSVVYVFAFGNLINQNVTFTPYSLALFLMTHGLFVVGSVLFRKDVERVRQSELQAANQALRESEILLEQRVTERTRDLSIASDIARQITTILDRDELLNTVVQRTKDAFNLYHVSIFIYDKLEDRLLLEAGSGEIGKTLKAQRTAYDLQQTQGLIPRAAQLQQAVVVGDVSKEPFYLSNPLLPAIQSEAAFPMTMGGRMVGVLDFQSDKLNRFSAEEVSVMKTLAEQVAIGIENARLFNETKESRKETERLLAVSEAINASQSYVDIVAAIAAHLELPGNAISLGLFENHDKEHATFMEVVALRPKDAQKTINPKIRYESEFIRNWAHRDLIVVDDTANPPPAMPKETAEHQRQQGVGSMMISGLSLGDRILGALNLNYPVAHQFTGSEKRYLRAAADLAAAAVERTRLYEEQVAVAEQLREVDAVKSRFLASMSHELRTPLNAILNFTKFVSTGMLGTVNQKQVEALDKSIGSGKHLLALINDVLDITKIESGMLNLFIEADVNILAELDTIRATGETLLAEKQTVQFVRDYPADLPTIVGDKRRIRQILLNLVSNACKFTDQGSVTLSAHIQGDILHFSVKDTGPGIAPEDQELIFESFRQSAVGIKQGGGTGLGLAIARRLAEAHGGKLWLESTLGQGAQFYVELPIASETLRSKIILPPNAAPQPVPQKVAS